MNWLHSFWFGYWWPSVKGNGPEDVTSLLIVGTATAIFVPVVRKWFKAHLAALHAKMDANKARLEHIIEHHPDIPDFPPDP